MVQNMLGDAAAFLTASGGRGIATVSARVTFADSTHEIETTSSGERSDR